MTIEDAKLATALVWDAEGHLAEPALHAVADAEIELLPEAALTHLEGCAHCSQRVGDVAMLALEVDVALATLPLTAAELNAAPAARRSTKPARSLPVMPVTCALLVAIAGNLPRLWGLDPITLREQGVVLITLVGRMTARAVSSLVTSGVGGQMVWLSALFLLAASVIVARTMPSSHSTRLTHKTGGRS
ncbi:MAG: hypothetical protein ABW321_00375 [Polyangiales bacterium]